MSNYENERLRGVNQELDKKVNGVLREINIAYEKFAKSVDINEKRSNLSDLKSFMSNFPVISGLISVNTTAKLIDISDRLSMELWKNDTLSEFDYKIFEIALYSDNVNKEQILKKFFMKKEKQIVYFLKEVPVEGNEKDFFINMRKISMLNKLIKNKDNVIEKKKLAEIFSLRGLILDENKLFKVIVVSKDKSYKKSTMIFDIASLNLYALINNANDVSVGEMNNECILKLIEGYQSSAKNNKIDELELGEIKELVHCNDNRIEIEMIIKNELNKQVCEIVAEKIKRTLTSSENILDNSNGTAYNLFYSAGKDMFNEIRALILENKLEKLNKVDLLVNSRKKI